MTLLKIARMGHPVLRRVADPVADPTDPNIRRLAQDMIETMIDAPGIGLAAPQIHAPLRLIVFRVPAARSTGQPDDGPLPDTVVVNPVVEPVGDERTMRWEGCLSIPGLRGEVPRWNRILYRGWDLDGRPVERMASGTHAGVVQHEVDHLDGVLYIDRMPDLKRLAFNEEMRHFVQD
ncbi:MAG TPA: peptide deformylase [Azospirillaceae bacterium]|nr:peptide deformylase [Azospirillaceae bacterium]